MVRWLPVVCQRLLVHPATLGHRLRRLGIDPREARNGALLHLAEHLPARVLADLLGLHVVTAERWITTAGTRWMGYADIDE